MKVEHAAPTPRRAMLGDERVSDASGRASRDAWNRLHGVWRVRMGGFKAAEGKQSILEGVVCGVRRVRMGRVQARLRRRGGC